VAKMKIKIFVFKRQNTKPGNMKELKPCFFAMQCDIVQVFPVWGIKNEKVSLSLGGGQRTSRLVFFMPEFRKKRKKTRKT